MQKFLVVCILLFSQWALANVQIKSTVDPDELSPKEPLNLTIEVEYKSDIKIRSPRLPPLSAFQLLNEQSVQEFQMINGEVKRKTKYIYTLRPIKEGVFIIGAVEVIVDNQVYKTQPIKVRVSSKIKPRPRARRTPSNPFGSMQKFMQNPFFGFKPRDMQPFQDRELKKGDTFIYLDTKQDSLYLGEMALVKWFYCIVRGRDPIHANIQVTEYAKTDGFWMETVSPVGASVRPLLKPLKKNGREYQKQLILSTALFPIRKGELKIGSMEVTAQLMSFLPFSGTPKVLVNKSPLKTIKVKPLPLEGKGDFFTEAVGDFNVSARINKKIISVGESFIYTINFEGQGHPRLIQLPELEFGKTFEVYDTSEAQQFSFKKSTKTFEIILIPKKAGRLLIPSFELTTFDPQLGIYKTHILSSFELKVIEKSDGSSGSLPDKDKRYFEKDEKNETLKEEEVGVKKTQLRPYLKEEAKFWLSSESKNKFWKLFYGILLFLFILVARQRFLSRKKEPALAARLRTRLIRVDQAIKAQNWKKAGRELNQFLYSFFGELSKDEAGKDWSTLLQSIPPSIRIKHEEQIKRLILSVERLSFASEESALKIRNKASVEQLRKEIIQLVDKIGS